MATLEINGRRVEVDDSFRALSPEQQQATVEEIAASMGSGERPKLSAPEAALYGAADAASFGTADEIRGGIRAVGDWIGNPLKLGDGKPLGEAYDARLAESRRMMERAREDQPVAHIAGQVGGAMLLPVGGAMRGGTVAAKAARGGAVGGAAYGFGSGEGGAQERAEQALIGGGIGAAAGRAVPLAVEGVRRGMASRAASKTVAQTVASAPTDDALRARSSALYDAAAARGVRVKPQVAQTFADDVAATAAAEGLDPILTPRSARAVERIQNMAASGKVAWSDIELARRVTGIASQSTDPAERRMAGIVSGKIDDFVLNLVDGDLDAGTAQGLSKELSEARSLWQRMRGSERVGAAMEAAKDAASGYENGLRIEFRKLIKDVKFFRSLSKPEQAAIRQVVQGTTVGNILKRASRLSFGHGAQTNVLGASVGAGAGAALAGPIGAAAAPVAGFLAGRGAEKITSRAAEQARGLVASGGLPLLPAPQVSPVFENALARFSRGAAPVGVNALAAYRS